MMVIKSFHKTAISSSYNSKDDIVEIYKRFKYPDFIKKVRIKKSVLSMLCLLLIFGLCSKPSYGQTFEVQEWTLLKDIDGVRAYYMINNCSSQYLLYIKIANYNSEDKKVLWNGFIQKGGKAASVFPDIVPVNLRTGEELVSNCSNAPVELTVPINEGFSISDLTFNLIVEQ